MSGKEENAGGDDAVDAAKGVELLVALVAAAVAGGDRVDILLLVVRIDDTEIREAERLKTTTTKTAQERLKTTATTARNTRGQPLQNHLGALEDNRYEATPKTPLGNRSGTLDDNRYKPLKNT